jgi:hypothetical protein
VTPLEVTAGAVLAGGGGGGGGGVGAVSLSEPHAETSITVIAASKIRLDTFLVKAELIIFPRDIVIYRP